MNLDELQIKISIELDDLNKQLKSITKDIDNTLGPKATKKLMADNNKVIKSGLTSINKTTLNLVKKSRKDTTKEIEAMSKDINKSLTKAFDIDLTKFNSNITSAMNQARQTVRSVCNDIRRELNAALNINGNIRVTSKTTISGSATGSSGSNVASTMASSQYIGAMIIKATNAMLKNNNSNTSKLESKIDNSTNKIVSAIKNIKSVSIDGNKAGANNSSIGGNKTSASNGSVGSKTENTRSKSPSIIEVPYEIIIDEEPLEQVEDRIKLLGEGFRALAIETGKVNFILGKTGDIFEGTVQRMREAFNMVKSLGTSGINFDLGDTKEQILSVVELMKQIHSLRKGLVSDTTSFTYGEVITPQIVDLPMEQFKKVKEVIEDATYRVLDFEKALMNTSNFDLVGLGKLDTSQVDAMEKAFKYMQNIRKQSRMPRLNEPTEDYDASEFMAKELHRQVASLMDMAQELNEAFHKTPMGIDEAVQQANFLEGALDAVLENSKDLTSLSPQIAKSFEFARDILNQMTPGIRALANEIRSFTKPQAPAGIPMNLEEYDLNPPRPETPKIIEDIRKEIQEEIPINIDTTEAKEKLDKLIKQISEKFNTTLSELSNIDSRALEEGLASLKDWIPTLEKAVGELNQIDDERIKINLDTTDAQNSIEALKTSYEMLIDACKTNNLNAIRDLIPQGEEQTNNTGKKKYPSKPANGFGNGSGTSKNKGGKPPKPTIMGFGFGAYKNEIDALVKYAKKAASTVNKVISDALNPEVGPKALDKGLESIEAKVVNIAKAIKDGIVGAFNFAVSQIKKAINAIIDSLKKLGQAITNVAKTIGNFLVQHAKVIKAVVLGALSAIATAFMSSVNMIAGVITGVVLGLTAIIIKNFDKVAEIIKKLGTAITNVAKKVKDTLVNAFTTAIDFIVSKFNKLTETIKQVATKMKNWFMITFAYIADVIEDKFDKCIQVIKKVASAVANVARIVKSTLVNAFITAIDFITNKFNKLTNAVKQVATKTRNWLMIGFAHILDVIEDKFNNISRIIKKVASAIANVAKTIKDALVNAFTTAVDFIVDKFNKIANTVKQVATNIKNWFMITFAYIADVIEDKFNKVFEVIKKIGSAIANVAKTVKNTLVNAFTTAIDFIVDKFNKVATAINNAFTKIKNNLMITFAYVADVIEDKFNKIKDSITKVFKHITILAKAYGKVIAKHLNKIFSPIANIAKKIKNWFMIAFAYVADIIEDKFNKVLGVIKKVGTSIANVAKKVVQPFKNAMAKVVSTVKNGVDKIKELFGKIKNSIVQGFNKAVDSVKSVIGKITSSVKDGFNKVVDSVKSIISKISSSVKNGFGKATNSVKSAMSKISSSVKSGFDKAASSVKSAMGKVSSAIRSGFGKTKATVNKMASSIRNSFSNIKTSKLYTNISKTLNKSKNAVSKFAGKVRPALNKAFSSVKTGKLNTNVSKALNKAQGAVSRFSGKARPTLNKAFSNIKTSKIYTNVSKALNKAKGAVSKFSNKVRPTLNKAFSNIKVGNIAGKISKGLSKAKGVLSKFASGCKTIWGKIRQIFSKGANDASKATGKLTSGLKGLLSQAFGFFSIYSLINLGREAITQSQTLAQAEIKLTSLMKQRMGATNDTVTAIRQLVEEQSKLGVVSKTALTRGAEQLSMYVHSAKALKELMPAIANLTAKRGGFMATEDDAEEIATQLGEAIREGTTTPLEQSGIYLSEAEIKKFAALRTEEERAAYLANVIAKNVGNINQALANTPIGAMTQLKNNFKELLGTLGIFLANVLKPIVKWLNYIVVACNNALKGLGKLLGFDMTGGATSVPDVGTGGGGGGSTPIETPTDTEIDTGGVDNVTDSYDNAADAADKATEANEKFKGSLMGFDEINVLSDNTSSNSGSDPSDEYDPTDITPGEGGQLTPLPEVGELTEADSIFSKFGDKIKAFMDEILEPFKNAWDLLGDRWKAEWGDLLKSFEHFCTSLATFLKSVWEHGGKEFVQHMAEIGLACGIAAMEIGGEILDSLARLWEHLDPAKNMNTQGLLNALNEVSVKVRDFILGLGDHFESFMANGGQDLLNAFGDMAMNIGEAIVRGIGVGIDALDGLIDHLDPANNPKTKNMLKSWENAFGSIGDMALSFVGLLESTLENGGQEIINSLGDLGVDIIAAIGVVVDEVAKAFAELFDHMDPAKNKNSKDMLKSFDKLIDSIDEFVVAATKLFKKFMDAGGREFIKNLGDIVAIVLDLAAAIGSGVIDLITGFMNSWVGQAMIEACAKALVWFSEKLEGLKDIIEPLKDVFQDVVDFIVGIFEGDGEKVGRAFVSFIKNALKVGFELSKFMAEIGEELILGLIEGIKALPGLLWECVKFIFDFIVGTFKELFGIHSPSTVFRDLGVNLMEGLIEGIESLITAIGDVFTSIKEAVVGWVKDIVDGAVEKWGELKESITTNLGELKETVSTKWQEIKENVSEKCKDIYEDAKDKWGNVKKEVSDRCKDIYDDTKKKWGDIKKELSDRCKDIYEDTKKKWDDTKKDVAEKCKNIYDDTKDKWTNIKNTTGELVDKLKSETEEKYGKFRDNLTNTMDNWRSNSEEKWNTIKNKTNELSTKLKDEVEEKYGKFRDNLTGFMENWRSNNEGKWDAVKGKTNELVDSVKGDVEKKYEKFRDNLTGFMENWRSNNEGKWGEVKKNTFDLVNVLRADAEGLYLTMQANLGFILDDVKTEASTKWDNIKSTTTDLIDKTVSEASRIFGNIKGGLTSKLDDAKAALEPKWETLKSNAKTKAEGMVSSAKSGFSGLSGALTDAIDDAKDAASRAWKGVKDAFSKLEFSMPKIKLPKLKVEWETLGSNSSWFPSIKYPKLSWYARGGIIDGITPLGFANGSMHMAGEAGKEMVVPLENTSFTSKIAQAMGQAVDNAMARNMNSMYGSYANNSSDSKDIILKVNERELARASINSINKLQRESGRTLLDI